MVTFGIIPRKILLLCILNTTFYSCGKTNDLQEKPAGKPEFIVNTARTISSGFRGFGTQYNQNVYSVFSSPDGISTGNLPQLEQKVKALKSQYVRIFFDSKAWPSDSKYSETPGDFMESFVKTVKLAQDAGASAINITYWHTATPEEMPQFAGVIYDLLINKKLTAVTEITVQNEPNSTTMSQDVYHECYLSLDQSLKTLGIRDRIEFIGGDLVQTNQESWFNFMGAKMNTLLAGYSTHVYWDDNDAAKPVNRLTEVISFAKGLGSSSKPVYVTEYGVRGGNKTGAPTPGYLTGTSTLVSQTTTSALQNALFQINGLNLGFSGFIRWDCYKAKYDNGTQYFSCIGSGTDGYPLYPLYYMTWLFTHTSRPGWKVVESRHENNPLKYVAAMTDQEGMNLTLYALNKSNGLLPFAIGGLPPGKSFRQLVWNKDQDGKLVKMTDAVSDEKGVIRLNVPGQSVTSLTTFELNISELP
jgi:hypothetical protein